MNNPLLNSDTKKEAREILVRNYLDSNLPYIFAPLIEQAKNFGPHAQAEVAYMLFLLFREHLDDLPPAE